MPANLFEVIRNDLGDPSGWDSPVEFRDSLALCALNSAYSLQGTTTAAVRVLERYRAARPSARTDDGPALVLAMDSAGGPASFAHSVLRNRSKLPGTSRLRTEGVYEAMSKFSALSVPLRSTGDLRARAADPEVRATWLSVRGLGPLSWSYLLMNAGVTDEVKPDVKVRRYLSRRSSGGRQVSVEEARQILIETAGKLHVAPRVLDRAIWLHESKGSE